MARAIMQFYARRCIRTVASKRRSCEPELIRSLCYGYQKNSFNETVRSTQIVASMTLSTLDNGAPRERSRAFPFRQMPSETHKDPVVAQH